MRRLQTSTAAIILAGGEEDKGLSPLTSPGIAKALLPVSNRALILYPLKALYKAGLRHAFVVRALHEPCFCSRGKIVDGDLDEDRVPNAPELQAIT